MRIYNNTYALSILNERRLIQKTIDTSSDRISSGLRINNAVDDPSGLAISNLMTSQIRGTAVAITNVQDSINLLKANEGVLNEINEKVNRIRDLAIRGANEAVLTDSDRQKLQNEITSLIDEIDRAANGVTFNTKKIASAPTSYNYDFPTLANGRLTITPPDDTMVDPDGVPYTDSSYTERYNKLVEDIVRIVNASLRKVFFILGITPQEAENFNLEIAFITNDGMGNSLAGVDITDPANPILIIDLDDFLYINPATGVPFVSTDTTSQFSPEMIIAHEMTHVVMANKNLMGPDPEFDDSWANELMATFVSQEMDLRVFNDPAGVEGSIATFLESIPSGNQDYGEVALAAQFISEVHGTDKLTQILQQQEKYGPMDFKTAVMNVLGLYYDNDWNLFENACDAWSVSYIQKGEYNSVAKEGIGWTKKTWDIGNNSKFGIQIGPNSTDSSSLITAWATAGALDYLAFVDVTTTENAQRSINTIDRAISLLNVGRTAIGIQQRNLQHVAEDLHVMYQNLTSSRSKILDADVAVEITNLTRAQILLQSTLAMLAQATYMPQIDLNLIVQSVK